jgi:pseudaminic acid cytidylyltransferase
MNNLRCVAIIPARGGSKRIPRKNIKLFNGKPIIFYSISEAIKSGLFSKVIVSTDDEEIAVLARQYGADVPFLRSEKLSDDFSLTKDVVNHALHWLESNGEIFDFACTLYPTAPFVQSKYLKQGIEELKNSDAIYSVAVTSMPFPIFRTFKVTEKNRIKMFWPEHFETRSQDLPEAYQDAGQFCWQNIALEYKEAKNNVVFSEATIPIILPRHLVQDIDTIEDWKRAELMYKVLKQEKRGFL